MTTKQLLLTALESHRGEYLSGEALAKQFNISRSAIWKAIRELRQEGHEIDAVTGAGYRLAAGSDRLSAEGILAHIKTPLLRLDDLRVLQTTTSTNQVAKQMAAEGARHGALVVAEEQTAGRGRMGRSFFSPNSTGLYLSVLLRPAGSAAQAALTTTATAVAVSRAIFEWSGRRVGIKWVNDLFYNQRKICGILAEAATDMQTGHMESLVVGIGINLSTSADEFPKDIRSTAGSLFSAADHPMPPRNHLTALIYDQILDLADPPDPAHFISEYRANCFIIDQPVEVIRIGQAPETVIARDIDAAGGLVVERADGSCLTLNSGEVSLKPFLGKEL